MKKQETFILLGINGAGKSTTFKCLTGEEQLSSGEIMIDGTHIQNFQKDPRKMGHKIGYCPQTNMFIRDFSVKENLMFWSEVLGIKEDKFMFAKYYAKKFNITNFFYTQAKSLSGGNQRKLCTAMAMMGHRPGIFLDESSAGVDPYSRRLLWKTIREESN